MRVLMKITRNGDKSDLITRSNAKIELENARSQCQGKISKILASEKAVSTRRFVSHKFLFYFGLKICVLLILIKVGFIALYVTGTEFCHNLDLRDIGA